MLQRNLNNIKIQRNNIRVLIITRILMMLSLLDNNKGNYRNMTNKKSRNHKDSKKMCQLMVRVSK